MSYNIGALVRIESKEWIAAQPKDSEGDIFREGEDHVFAHEMYVYAGKMATIVFVGKNGDYKLDIDEQRSWWSEWMFDLNFYPDGILPSKLAIDAMVEGKETLYDDDGKEYWFDENESAFKFRRHGSKCEHTLMDVSGLQRSPEKQTQSFTRWEILYWVNSDESKGWFVKRIDDTKWRVPQYYFYSQSADRYERAQLLLDKSGINESTIQRFKVEK
jgi:hypothetical protein